MYIWEIVALIAYILIIAYWVKDYDNRIDMLTMVYVLFFTVYFIIQLLERSDGFKSTINWFINMKI